MTRGAKGVPPNFGILFGPSHFGLVDFVFHAIRMDAFKIGVEKRNLGSAGTDIDSEKIFHGLFLFFGMNRGNRA